MAYSDVATEDGIALLLEHGVRIHAPLPCGEQIRTFGTALWVGTASVDAGLQEESSLGYRSMLRQPRGPVQ